MPFFGSYDPVDGYGYLPALRARGTAGTGSFVGMGRLSSLRSSNSVALIGVGGTQLLPRMRSFGMAAAAGDSIGRGALPRITAFGDAISAIPLITLGFGALPKLTGSGVARFEMRADGSGKLPALRSLGFTAAGAIGIGSLSALSAYGYINEAASGNGFSMFQSPGFVEIDFSADHINMLQESLCVAASVDADWTQVLKDSFAANGSLALLLRATQALSDGLSFAESVESIYRALVADAVSLGETPVGAQRYGRAVVDGLKLAGVFSRTVDSRVVLTMAIALHDAVRGSQRGSVTDAAAFVDALLATADHIAALLDQFALAATTTGSATLHAFLSDDYSFDSAASLIAAIRQALKDGMQLGLTLFTGQDTWTAWVMTPTTRAMREYLDYPFNSYAQIGDTLYGASDTGVYVLNADTDAGKEIYARVRTGLLDFGTRQLKRMDRAYLGYTSEGTLCMRVVTTSPEGEKVEYTYKMVAKPANAPRENRIPIGRGLQSVYWQFELDNSSDASRFELHDVVMLPMPLSRRIP